MLVPTYQPKLPRWKHQDAALQRSRGRKAFAYFMEMRTGKTKVVLDEFGELEAQGEIKHLLVVAPAGVYRTWEVDAEKHIGDSLRSRLRILRWDAKASAAAKKKIFDDIADFGPKILLVNIEALSAKADTARNLVAKFIKRWPTLMTIDESTVIKNYKAKRTKFCLKAGQYCKARRILSGLPSPQSPLDLYTQMAFLNPNITGFYKFTEFRERYGIVQQKPYGPGGQIIEIVTGYRNLDELSDKIKPHAYRVRLKECTDLPEKIYMRREVALTKEQEHHYNQIAAYATTILENEERVTATIVLTQLLRFQQILAGHMKTDDGNIVDVPENKTEELLSALGEHSGKAVIWVAFDQDVHKLTAKLREIYGPRSVARFWGKNRDTREDEEKQFLTDPKCRYMIATAASGGRGRTWANADLVVYYSNTFSLEHRAQSEERTQAVGKKTNVLYLDLICPNTVEEKILFALRNKMDLSDAVMKDGWRKWVTDV